jgi:hypothetical protein
MSTYTILFHGNCIDGWISTYIAQSVLKTMGIVKMYPISPSQPNTWPKMAQMTGTHVLLLDVSVAENHRAAWTKGGVLSISCIDHHQSAIEHWPADACPINTAACAAVQTWHRFYGAPMPAWLNHIDRIDRWDNPTYEDRCIREVLNIIAHKPVEKKMEEALAMTEIFIGAVNTAPGIMNIIQEGKVILDKKDAEIMMTLNKGSVHTLTHEHINMWKLNEAWLGIPVFIIDNTNITLDTTEAAHIVFTHYPQIRVFINYRKKTSYGRGADAVIKNMIVYSARSRDFNLTANSTFLCGHPSAAGASLIKEETPVLPFIISAV